MSEELQVVYMAGSAEQAHLLAAPLLEQGIDAVVENEVLRVGQGLLPFGLSTAPRVTVRKDDWQEARRIILELTGETEAPQRRWQFRMVTLLVVVTGLCVVFSLDRLSGGQMLPMAPRLISIGYGMIYFGAVAVLTYRLLRGWWRRN